MENRKYVITIILLIVIILGLAGFIALDKMVLNKNLRTSRRLLLMTIH